MVDSSGVFYLVQRTVYCGEKLHFKVYELYKLCSKWDEVIGLVTTRYCLWVLMDAFLCQLLIFQIKKGIASSPTRIAFLYTRELHLMNLSLKEPARN